MKTLGLEPTRTRLMLRRSSFAGLVGATALLIAWDAFLIARINEVNLLKAVSFVLFVILLLPIALSFWTATIGFIVQWRGGDTLDLTPTLGRTTAGADRMPRTAVVMPVYNEDPSRVLAGMKATYVSLESTGLLDRFDFFLLSDTTDPDTWVSEELAFAELRSE